MKNIWSDERNRLSVNKVKAEICTKLNFGLSCTDFSKFIRNHNKIIKAAKSDKKYTLKNQ